MMRTNANKLTVGAKFLALLTLLILSLSLSACHGGGGSGGDGGISPSTVTVASGASFPFTVGSNQEVVWKVNGVTGGSATDGTIDLTGVYTAPSAPTVVTVTAVSKASQALLGTSIATIVPFGGYTVGFQNISSMKNARSNHTATLLPSTVSSAVPTGYSLIAGGIGSSGEAIDKAELFNPAAPAFGHFSSIGNMTKPRAYHAATRLQNGQVLITGGIDNNNNPLDSAEIYDPVSRKFRPTGSMGASRWMHTATLLASGKVLVAAGISDPGPGTEGGTALDSAELYDPATGKFTTLTQSMNTPRYFHTATLLRNGKVLLVGGQGAGGQILPDAELFDPAASAFTATGSIMVDLSVDTGRWQHTATLLNDVNGSVIMIGGNAGTDAGPGASHLFSAQSYDPLLATFTSSITTNQMIDSRSHHASAMLANGNVLVTGGIGGNSSSLSDFLLSADLFNPVGVGSFVATANPMNFARANHTATALPNGKVVIIGGNNAGVFLKNAELYQ